MTAVTVTIGTWHEESREVTQHTSYAADHIEKVTKAGDYPLRLTFVGGYTMPMPQWLLVTLDAETVGGGYYSGLGGVNYGFRPGPKGPSLHHLQMQAHGLCATDRVKFPSLPPSVREQGRVTLDGIWADIPTSDYGALLDWFRENVTWEMLYALRHEQEVAA